MQRHFGPHLLGPLLFLVHKPAASGLFHFLDDDPKPVTRRGKFFRSLNTNVFDNDEHIRDNDSHSKHGVIMSDRANKTGEYGMAASQDNYCRVVQRSEHDRLAEMYESGMTLAQIGTEFGITRERVRQIISALGVTKFEGGQSVRMLKNTADKVAKLRAKEEKAEVTARARWGLSVEAYKAHVSEHGSSSYSNSPMNKFVRQRNSAHRRGVAWEITFADWWLIWQESGKWDERGRGAYVMARYGDGDAPYSKETVYICTQSENAKDSYIVSPASVRFANSPTKAGAGKGWYYAPNRSKPNPYYAQFNKKHLGGFPNAELARAAYEAAVEQHKQQA